MIAHPDHLYRRKRHPCCYESGYPRSKDTALHRHIIRKLAAISSPLKNPSSPQKPNAKRTAIAAVIIMRKRILCLITRFLVQKFRISCPTKQVEKIKRIIAIIEFFWFNHHSMLRVQLVSPHGLVQRQYSGHLQN